ncbi:MAG: lipopolysaccharide biosynthesis protein [Prevotella sp.]|nr:lipopolysaccharide biosynthesis protein [Candidatus Prevotella equi]
MADQSLKSKTLKGLAWQFGLKFFSQFFTFFVTLILTRLLTPEDYGVCALAGMFSVLMGIFVNGSMDAALIQKKNADELDYNTVFYSSLVMGVVMYVIVFFVAPIIADIYDNDLICSIMRVSGLSLPICASIFVQNAIVTKRMEFQKFFYRSFIVQVTAAIVGITMAYSGYGPWSLVGQGLTSCILNVLVMFCLIRWSPKLEFSWCRFRELFSYAWKKTAANFMGTLGNQMKGYLIGYKYTSADLAYFNRGESLPDMLKNNIAGTIDGVLFPAISKLQDDKIALKHAFRRSIMTTNYAITPGLLGLAATADKIVPLLYSEKWAPAVPFMMVACFSVIVVVLNNSNLQVLYAIGRTDVVMKQEFIKKPVMMAILFTAIFISPLAIAIGILFHNIHELFWTTYANAKYINYSLKEQLNDIKYGLLIGLCMFALVTIIGLFIENTYIALAIQIIVGLIIYISLSEILKPEAYIYTKTLVLEKVGKKFQRLRR